MGHKEEEEGVRDVRVVIVIPERWRKLLDG